MQKIMQTRLQIKQNSELNEELWQDEQDVQGILTSTNPQDEANEHTASSTNIQNEAILEAQETQEAGSQDASNPAVSSFRTRAVIAAVTVLGISYFFPATIAYFFAAATAFGVYKGFNYLSNRFFPEANEVIVTETVTELGQSVDSSDINLENNEEDHFQLQATASNNDHIEESTNSSYDQITATFMMNSNINLEAVTVTNTNATQHDVVNAALDPLDRDAVSVEEDEIEEDLIVPTSRANS